MKKIFKQIIVSTIILQTIFGFVLPAKAQDFTGGDQAVRNSNQNGAQASIDDVNSQITQANQNAGIDTSYEQAITSSQQAIASLQQAGRDARANDIPEDWCTLSWSLGLGIPRCVGMILLSIGGVFVGIAGTFLNFAIDTTVLQMSKIVNEVGVITAGWKTFRDLANMFFIFILIYIAIATIIGADSTNTRKSLVMVIVVALLINFSMFFTKVVIDASNILTIQFYNSITKGDSSAYNGLSWTFMRASNLTTIYSAEGNVGNAVASAGQSFKGSNVLLIGFFGLIFAVILSFCFVSIGILFVIRFVALLFVLMLSPLAFLGLILGKMRSVWDRWLDTLLKEAIFAPTIMAMLWIIAAIVNNPSFRNAINVDTQTSGGFVNVIIGTAKDSMGVAVNFGILIAMLIGSILIARSFSTASSSSVLGTAEKWMRRGAGSIAFGATGFAGRTLIGGSASWLSDRGALKTSRTGLAIQKTLKGVAGSSFDARAMPLVGKKIQETGAGEAHTGGYTEGKEQLRSFRDKVFQRDEKSVEKLKENKRSLEIEDDIEKIREGANAPKGTPLALASETAKARLKQNLAKMSEEDQVAMASEWLDEKIENQREIIEQLSPAAIKAIKKKAGLSPKEKDKITQVRDEKIKRELDKIKAGPGSPGYEDAIKNIQRVSAEELEVISDDIFEIQEFVENLSRKQTKSLLDNKEISSINKDKFKDLRKKNLEKSVKFGVPGDVKRILNNMAGEEVAKLDIDSLVKDPMGHHFLDNLSARQLGEAAESMRPSDIQTLRNAITNRNSPECIALTNWLNSPGGSQIFS